MEQLIQKYTEQLAVLKENRANTVDINNDAENEQYDRLIQQVAGFIRELKQLNLPVVMPRKLTAENGAKILLIGEFAECFDPEDCGNPYVVPISWDSIKRIYDKIVSHYGA